MSRDHEHEHCHAGHCLSRRCFLAVASSASVAGGLAASAAGKRPAGDGSRSHRLRILRAAPRAPNPRGFTGGTPGEDSLRGARVRRAGRRAPSDGALGHLAGKKLGENPNGVKWAS